MAVELYRTACVLRPQSPIFKGRCCSSKLNYLNYRGTAPGSVIYCRFGTIFHTYSDILRKSCGPLKLSERSGKNPIALMDPSSRYSRLLCVALLPPSAAPTPALLNLSTRCPLTSPPFPQCTCPPLLNSPAVIQPVTPPAESYGRGNVGHLGRRLMM